MNVCYSGPDLSANSPKRSYQDILAAAAAAYYLKVWRFSKIGFNTTTTVPAENEAKDVVSEAEKVRRPGDQRKQAYFLQKKGELLDICTIARDVFS